MNKIISVLGVASLMGLIMGFAAATINTNSFNEDISIIYGEHAKTGDILGSKDISNDINSKLFPAIAEFDETNGVLEKEVPLGVNIAVGDIKPNLRDNQIPHLIDGKIEWDNGNWTKHKFNVREEINIGDMEIRTTFDDNELNETALTNNKGLSYKYVFEDDIGWDRRDEEKMDHLKISILGKEYEITDMTDDSISILNSNKYVLKDGESIVVDGVTLTVNNIFHEYVEINNVILEEDEDNVEEVDNLRIIVDTVAHSETEGRSRVVLDVSKAVNENIEIIFEDGDEYIENDDTWIWDINEPGKKDGYISVKYDIDSIDPDEGIIYAGGSYILPEEYAELKFVETTDVDYNEFKVYFDDKDLYRSIGDLRRIHDDANVVIIKGKNDDSIVLKGDEIETDSIYLYRYYNTTLSKNITEVYFKDVHEEIDDNDKIRFANSYDDTVDSFIATLIVDNTEANININGFTLTLNGIEISLGGTEQFTHLGATEKDGESDDVKVNGNGIGTEENDVMDYYGNIIENPENNAENDKVIIQVPSEQVYATISVLGEPQYTANVSDIDFTISTSSMNDEDLEKNMIVVGGSCINEIAAELLGSAIPVCGVEFTELTGVKSGEYMIKVLQNPDAEDKIAVLIAGYNEADTTRGVKEFLEDEDFDLTIGTKVIR